MNRITLFVFLAGLTACTDVHNSYEVVVSEGTSDTDISDDETTWNSESEESSGEDSSEEDSTETETSESGETEETGDGDGDDETGDTTETTSGDGDGGDGDGDEGMSPGTTLVVTQDPISGASLLPGQEDVELMTLHLTALGGDVDLESFHLVVDDPSAFLDWNGLYLEDDIAMTGQINFVGDELWLPITRTIPEQETYTVHVRGNVHQMPAWSDFYQFHLEEPSDVLSDADETIGNFPMSSYFIEIGLPDYGQCVVYNTGPSGPPIIPAGSTFIFMEFTVHCDQDVMIRNTDLGIHWILPPGAPPGQNPMNDLTNIMIMRSDTLAVVAGPLSLINDFVSPAETTLFEDYEVLADTPTSFYVRADSQIWMPSGLEIWMSVRFSDGVNLAESYIYNQNIGEYLPVSNLTGAGEFYLPGPSFVTE